ncbi:MAG: nitrile hydratase subunit beta [Geminicoccaceae bacterium]|nr:nitrile hydratase subunit beta [Geminicoccaceae bacterium]
MSDKPRFDPGATVRVKPLTPPGHVRTPWFTRGKSGRVVQVLGTFGNPESLAYGGDGEPLQPLYRISFRQSELWADYDGKEDDTLVADIYEHWLEPIA